MARYWRLVGISTLGGVALELSSARLSDGTVYSAAVVTCAVAPQTGTLSDLTDGNQSTVVSWPNYAQPGFALVWDCGASPITNALVELGSGAVQANFPVTARLESSDDAKFWTVYFEAKNIKWPGANALSADPLNPAADYHFADVSLLLLGNGATIIDSSATPKTLTAAGTAATSTTQSKFGGSSIYFDGVGAYLSSPTEVINSSDFTVEFWAYLVSGTNDYDYFVNIGSGPVTGMTLRIADGGYGNALQFSINDTGRCTGSSRSALMNAWHHIAATRLSSVCMLFLDGVLLSSATNANSISSTSIYVGADAAGANLFNGYIDDFRLTNGVARYTSNFTPPTSQLLLGAGTLPLDSSRATQIYALNNHALPSNLPGSDLQPFAQYLTLECKFANDVQDGGTGRVSGTVKETGAPADVPVHRKVRLLEETGGRTIRETWSDPVTGYYEFNDLSRAQKYTVISYDYLHNYRAVIADNQEAIL